MHRKDKRMRFHVDASWCFRKPNIVKPLLNQIDLNRPNTLLVDSSDIRMQANFRGRENIWQFDIDARDRLCFQMFLSKSVYIDKVMWLESM